MQLRFTIKRPIAWQGRRAGAGRGGTPPSKVSALFFLLVALLLPQVASAQGEVVGDPTAPCRFNPDATPEMVVLNGGQFLMGSPDDEVGRDKDEGPQHWVSVQPFAIGRCEVTVAEFGRFVSQTGYITEAERVLEGGDKAQGCFSLFLNLREILGIVDPNLDSSKRSEFNWRNPGFEQGDNSPVVCLSWNDVQQYIRWLNYRTDKTYRLPTEVEWEYAARAGTTTPFATGECISTEQANFNGTLPYSDCLTTEENIGRTVPVASYPANPFDLFDLHGNVWEWVEDCWHGNYTGAPNDGSAWLAENSGDCSLRVVRDGSWSNNAENLRSASRSTYYANVRDLLVGFRLARTLD